MKCIRQLFEGLSLSDFHAYMRTHSYIYAPSREMWPAGSVNARIPPLPVGPIDENGERETINASAWIDQNKPVEQMTWTPGLPMIIKNRLISEGGWIERNTASCFNLYRPSNINPGDPSLHSDLSQWRAVPRLPETVQRPRPRH